MTGVLVRTLLLRGQRAHRLARVAAVELPAALARTLADIEDVHIDALSVRLDFDPSDLDDATIATLWAEAIRREVLASGGVTETTLSRARRANEAAARHPSRLGTRATDVIGEARRWLSTPAPRGPVPTAALSLADPAVAAEAAALIGPEQWARLVSLLDAALATPGAHRHRSSLPPQADAPARGDDTRTAVGPPARDMDPDEAPPVASAGQPDVADGKVARSEHAFDRAAAARVAALAELVEVGTAALGLDTVTRAAGLALLYPWLGDLCREAVDLHPGRDAATVRALALATLVAPADASLASDPLVTLLAGLAEPVDSLEPALALAEEVLARCDRVLVSFASLLPGFASSTSTFVREQWVSRVGVIDTSQNPVLLSAATHPLDVILTLLPYPVALFALPWTAPLAVRFRP